jgi:hypothetical protein
MGSTPGGVAGRSRPPTESGLMDGPGRRINRRSLSGNRVAADRSRTNVRQ